MVKKDYVPNRGDLVWIDFNPQKGHEQKGLRPAIVISHKKYNEKTGLAVFCPITSKEKGYPFETKIKGKKITGVVLSDQIKSLDWKIRKAEFIEKTTEPIINEIIDKIKVIIE